MGMVFYVGELSVNSTALIVYWHGAVHSSHYLPIAIGYTCTLSGYCTWLKGKLGHLSFVCRLRVNIKSSG